MSVNDNADELPMTTGPESGPTNPGADAVDDPRTLNLWLAQELQARTAQLQARNQELDDFSHSLSHDLRAPLRHIEGFAKILVQQCSTQLQPEARAHLERVRAGAEQMGRMIDGLLHLAEIGRRPLLRRRVSLRTLAEEAVKNLARETAGRAVDWQIGELGEADCDPDLIRQVFASLLSNALKYTRPRASASVRVGAVTGSAGPRQARAGEIAIFVRDNGVGFSMKYIERLFGAFQRLHRTEEFEGVGIGLATARRIIHRHGGRIWAEAEVDKGATFYFTLPPGGSPGIAGAPDSCVGIEGGQGVGPEEPR